MVNAGVFTGAILLLFAGILFREALTYDYYGQVGPGPGLFPVWLSGVLMVLSILFIIDSHKNCTLSLRDILPRGEGFQNVVVFVVALIGFLIITPYAGYLVTNILMLFLLFLLGYRWSTSLLLAVLITGIVYYLFQNTLGVPLPVGLLGI